MAYVFNQAIKKQNGELVPRGTSYDEKAHGKKEKYLKREIIVDAKDFFDENEETLTRSQVLEKRAVEAEEKVLLLEKIVEEAIASAKDKEPESYTKYKGDK